MKGPALWGAIAVSVVALVGFIYVSVMMFGPGVSPELKGQLMPVVVTGWLGLAGTSVGFWVGSSANRRTETPPEHKP